MGRRLSLGPVTLGVTPGVGSGSDIAARLLASLRIQPQSLATPGVGAMIHRGSGLTLHRTGVQATPFPAGAVTR